MKFRSRFRTASLISALLVLGLLGCLSELRDGNHAQREASDRERESLALSAELRNSSDELTRLARTYVVTGNSRYEKQYWSVLALRDGREPRADGHRAALRTLMQQAGFTKEELALLQKAEDNSNALVAIETAAFQAMIGKFMPEGKQSSRNPDDYRSGAAPDPAYATRIMHDGAYHAAKTLIMGPIAESAALVAQRTRQAVEAAERKNTLLVVLALVAGGALLVLLWLNHLLAHRPVLNAIANVTSDLEQISSGTIDLSRRLDSQSADELGDLARSVDRTLARLSELVGRLVTASSLVSDVATDITTAAQQQMATSMDFGTSTNQIAASTNEISATSRELLQTISEVTSATTATAQVVGSGRADLERMDATIQELSAATASISAKFGVIAERAKSIGAVVTTIIRVADQTNLLSLNAAIEAEKAKEYGLGFAVVAREIRRLADQTAVATLDIEQIVKEMQASVISGVMEMDRFNAQVRTSVGETARISEQLGGLIKGVEELLPRLDLAQQGMESQAVGANQINDAMIQLREIAIASGETSYRLQGASARLQIGLESLQAEIAGFRAKT
jgi:methyl-accepting chemotaxis protein